MNLSKGNRNSGKGIPTPPLRGQRLRKTIHRMLTHKKEQNKYKKGWPFEKIIAIVRAKASIPLVVIPAKAGIQSIKNGRQPLASLDSRYSLPSRKRGRE